MIIQEHSYSQDLLQEDTLIQISRSTCCQSRFLHTTLRFHSLYQTTIPVIHNQPLIHTGKQASDQTKMTTTHFDDHVHNAHSSHNVKPGSS